MSNTIPEAARQGIIDKLICIGQVTGRNSYEAFFQRVYPSAATIKTNRKTLLEEIAQHCDRNIGDWGDDAGIFFKVGFLHWSDQEFLLFCREYVNPVFTRTIWDEYNEQRVNLQQKCVDAINFYLKDCGYELRPSNHIGDKIEYSLVELTGVKGTIQCILFAAIGKPDLVLTDVLNQTVQIPVDDEKYLLYDREVSSFGLSWRELNTWYREQYCSSDQSFLQRIQTAVTHCNSKIEETFFNCYLDVVAELGDDLPALLPQVYLYYDPKVQKERTIKIFEHQCMDFMMLFSESQRVVIELDGVQHYSDESIQFKDEKYPRFFASPTRYSQMVRAQREMTLAGYEVYRFGGSELHDQDRAKIVVKQFFINLFLKHGVDIP